MADRGPLRVGNCSGFYGDRLAAMREMLEGGPLDVLTGDYLAELTMLILGRDQLKDPSLGYARTFVRQVEDCLGLALERGVRIVSNAGGLNPAGLAARLREVAAGLGLSPSIAYVDGDDVRSLGFERALTANAYLGGFGIAAALGAGADIVVTGRVTDASLVVGPAAWWHGWSPTSYDELAGAVVAGHVLECGCQATGGNFSDFSWVSYYLEDERPLGFPIAEIAADGSCVVTKHPDTAGLVTVDTVTAQLMYEIQGPLYLGPDVTLDLTSVRLCQQEEDDNRVQVSGVRGQPPPERLKVCVNELGGYRNQVEFVLTGLDIHDKADLLIAQVGKAVDEAGTFGEARWSVYRVPEPDSPTEEGASCLVRLTVKDPSADRVGRAFTAPVIELALSSYPGFALTAPPGPPTPYGVYRAEYVDRADVTETVHLADGSTLTIDPPPTGVAVEPESTSFSEAPPDPSGPTRRMALGAVAAARSGDKGGDANIGLWVRQGDHREERSAWLRAFVTPDRVRELVPEAAELDVEVHQLPNLGGCNVVVRGLLGDGVAASTRFDPQAKGLGEWVRSRVVSVPEGLL
jgi:hypothetical protein